MPSPQNKQTNNKKKTKKNNNNKKQQPKSGNGCLENAAYSLFFFGWTSIYMADKYI